MIQFLITLILFGVIAICFGIMDVINFHFHKAPKWMRDRRSFWGKKAMENNKWAIVIRLVHPIAQRTYF